MPTGEEWRGERPLETAKKEPRQRGLPDMKLYRHQLQVLCETERFNRVGYFLDMGLGKTFVGSEKMWQLNAAGNLLICQKSKIGDWVQHFTEYYPDYLTYDLTEKGQAAAFRELAEDGFRSVENHQSILGVINYELAFRRPYLAHMEGFTLMLDESQYIQNEQAKRSRFVLSLKPENVILLSGTPTSGKYERLWSQCRLLGWRISREAFWNTYVETEWAEDPASGYKRQTVTGYQNIGRLKRRLAEHGAVFMKTEEAFGLPEQQEIVARLPVSREYRKFMKDSYLDLDLKNQCGFQEDSDFFGTDVTPHVELVGDTVLTRFLYARQLCGQYSADKVKAVADLIDSTDERVVVFYNFNAELQILKHLAAGRERPFSEVNGKKRDLSAYETCRDSLIFVQYRAGATGLNLQKAHITVYFTLPFGKGSCALWEQSKKRTHRIGQEKRCLYYCPVCRDSVEERNLLSLRLGQEYNERLFEKEEESGGGEKV